MRSGGGSKSSLDKGFGLFKALKTACNYLHRNSKVVLILSFCLITTAVLAAGRCVPCKLNHYCVDGLRYQCPSNAPVTQGTGAGALSECLTCTQRNGNSANPIYDDLVGDCVSCIEYNSETPYWDGNACVACASGTAWDAEENTCVATLAPCEYEIPHGDGTLCLVESVNYTAYESISPQSAEEETDEFLTQYGIVDVSSEYPDYWAGAMKYCQDKGLRLPTMDELVSIMNVVYGTSKTCEDYCSGTSSDKTGCCTYSALTLANQSLFDFLAPTGSAYLWSSAEYSSGNAHSRAFASTYSRLRLDSSRDGDSERALCVR